MSQRIVVEGGGFRIESGYDPDPVAALKMVIGRRWDAAGRVWTVPLAQATPLKAIALRFGWSWPQEADKRAEEQAARRDALAATSRATDASVDVDLKGFVGELRPYQKADVVYLLVAKRSIQTQLVNAVHLVAERTIDDRLLDVVNRKRAIAERAITGGAVASATASVESSSVLGEVLAAYRAQTPRSVRPRGIVLAEAA